MPRYWTVDEARAALPDVIALLQRLQAALGATPPRHRAAAPADGVSVNGHGAATRGQPDDPATLLRRITEMGVQVKDIATGLIDFPHTRARPAGSEEEVLLCYRLGEVGIAYWHDTRTGFAGRRPLTEL